jgi:tRNA-dihydrouridine synthase A
MRSPELVADLCVAVGMATGSAPSVKCRIGVDELDSYQYLSDFIHTVSTKGNVSHFIIHARKAILGQSFSPHQNRTVPALNYPCVYQLIKDFPYLQFTLNGGVVTYEDMLMHEAHGVHGIMIGRGVIRDPYFYRHVDKLVYGDHSGKTTSHNMKYNIRLLT